MRIVLPIAPVPCPRPRVSKFGVYYPPKYKQWRKQALALLPKPKQTYTEGVLRVLCDFNVKVPKSYSKKQREEVLRGSKVPSGDIDNYQKSLFDLLTDAGYWSDDVLIGSVTASKCYAEEDSIAFEIMVM